MNVLMFGPGKGNNISLFLNYFQKRNLDYNLSYFYFTRQEHYSLKDNFPNIRFIPFYNIPSLVWQLIKKPDLLWIHNWTPLPVLILIQFFRSEKSFVNFNIWSEPLPKSLNAKTLRSKIYRFILKSYNVIQCNWYGTYDIVKDIPGLRPVVLPWGIDDANFLSSDGIKMDKETMNFVTELAGDRTKFFYPKSINGSNNHDLVLASAAKLLERGVDDFVIYIWEGNHNIPKVVKQLKADLIRLSLEDHVRLVSHGFVKNYEMKFIWEQMDCGLNVVSADQLSATFIEPQLYEKEIISSNISAYRYYEKEFKVNLNLIEVDVLQFAERMQKIIGGQRTHQLELKHRRIQIENNYRFSTCMDSSLNFFDRHRVV